MQKLKPLPHVPKTQIFARREEGLCCRPGSVLLTRCAQGWYVRALKGQHREMQTLAAGRAGTWNKNQQHRVCEKLLSGGRQDDEGPIPKLP